MSEIKKPEIVFAPGCFDDFDGTQEELDEMVAELTRLVETGEIFEKSSPVVLEDLLEQFSDEDLETLLGEVESITNRTLQ